MIKFSDINTIIDEATKHIIHSSSDEEIGHSILNLFEKLFQSTWQDEDAIRKIKSDRLTILNCIEASLELSWKADRYKEQTFNSIIKDIKDRVIHSKDDGYTMKFAREKEVEDFVDELISSKNRMNHFIKREAEKVKQEVKQEKKMETDSGNLLSYKDILESIYKNTHKPKEILDNHQLLVFKQHIDNDTDKPCEIVGHRLLETSQFHIAETIAKREKAFNEVEILLVGDLDKHINQDKELTKATIENPNVSDLDRKYLRDYISTKLKGVTISLSSDKYSIYNERSLKFLNYPKDFALDVAKDFKNQGYQCGVMQHTSVSSGDCHIIIANDKQALNETKQSLWEYTPYYKDLNLNNANSKEQSKQKNKDNERGL